jgi:hypothetical protein
MTKDELLAYLVESVVPIIVDDPRFEAALRKARRLAKPRYRGEVA